MDNLFTHKQLVDATRSHTTREGYTAAYIRSLGTTNGGRSLPSFTVSRVGPSLRWSGLSRVWTRCGSGVYIDTELLDSRREISQNNVNIVEGCRKGPL